MAAMGVVSGAGATTPPGSAALPGSASRVVVVTDARYGAVGDGVTNDRLAMQAAIDHVAARGGGTVVLPAGKTFLSGSLQLASRVTLRVDGTLLQSQAEGDYATATTRGHLYPGNIAYRLGDLAMLHNMPMVYAGNARNVAVTGSGTIQLTRAQGATPLERENATIHAAAIGFYRVDGFQIRDVSLLGASSFSLSLYTTSNGLVAGTRIVATLEDSHPGGANTDGISIQNSQHIRVTDNVVRAGDDGIYVWASYQDERGGETGWWSSDEPRPSYDIEIDHNDIVAARNNGALCCSAVSLIAWGGGGSPTGGNAPDQRQVQISDIRVHDNYMEAGYPFRCWCGSPNSQSPLTRVTLERNEYVWGFTPGNNLRGQITDFTTDADEWYEFMSARVVKNGNFEATADAWWTTSGTAGATRADDQGFHPWAMRDRLAEAEGWVGYLWSLPTQRASISQAILPIAPQDLPPIGVESVRHEISADVVTSGTPARLVVRSRCDGSVIDEQQVDAKQWTRVSLELTTTSRQCGGVRVAFESVSGRPGWALIDDITHTSSYEGNWIDSTDPRVQVSGRWATYAGATDVGGNHLVGLATGANLTVPFSGPRAQVLATRDVNLGMADVYIDGVRHGTIDFYARTRADGVIVYDTGDIGAGDHVFELRTTGTKNPASTNVYSVFDALLLPG
jgi:hypothetical protein